MKTEYLGDGVYVEFDGCSLKLFTLKDGFGMSNEIYLDGMVYSALVGFVGRLKNTGDTGE